MEDKFLSWLKERKKKIEDNIDDELFKKVLLEIHNDYAEQYICLRREDKSET